MHTSYTCKHCTCVAHPCMHCAVHNLHTHWHVHARCVRVYCALTCTCMCRHSTHACYRHAPGGHICTAHVCALTHYINMHKVHSAHICPHAHMYDCTTCCTRVHRYTRTYMCTRTCTCRLVPVPPIPIPGTGMGWDEDPRPRQDHAWFPAWGPSCHLSPPV